MSTFDFKKSAKANTTAVSPVIGEKTKVSTEEVLAKYNGEITKMFVLLSILTKQLLL